MKSIILLTLFSAVAMWACTGGDCNPAAADNVNSRYTVESVDFAPKQQARLSPETRDHLKNLVGAPFDEAGLEKLVERIRGELRAYTVTHRIVRGDQPESVKVVFEVRRKGIGQDAAVTKFAYHSKQGWTGKVEAGDTIHGTRFALGIQSDADELIERYAGWNGRLSQNIGDHLRLQFAYGSFHQIWNRATLTELEQRPDVPGIYRERQSFEPSLSVQIAEPLTLTVGISLQHLQTQFPAARTEAANAMVNTLRYHGEWRSSSSSGQELDAVYSLRAATSILDSDFRYTRHSVDLNYLYERGPNALQIKFAAGRLGGRAPLFDRYSLGNTERLRGWNKFDFNPVGGSRMVYGSAAYRHRALGFFYDTGAVWDRSADRAPRHSAGASVGLNAVKDGPYLAVAFPIRGSRVQPLFTLSMNF